MPRHTTAGDRTSILIGGLLVVLVAGVCVTAITQQGVLSLLASLVGGPAVLSVGVAIVFLVAGLISLRAVGGRATPTNDHADSLLRESASQEESTEPTTAPAVENESAPPAKPRPAPRDEPPVLKQLPLQWTDESGGHQTRLVDVTTFSASDFSLMVEGPFEQGQAVWIADGDELRRGVVKFVEGGTDRRRMDVHLLTRERRRAQRVEGAGRAHVLWSDHRRGEQKTMVSIRNFSDEGFQVYSSKSVQPGRSVLLKGESLHTAAKALYCTPDGEGYLVGMRFLTDSDLQAPKPQWTESTELEMETRSETDDEGSDAE